MIPGWGPASPPRISVNARQRTGRHTARGDHSENGSNSTWSPPHRDIRIARLSGSPDEAPARSSKRTTPDRAGRDYRILAMPERPRGTPRASRACSSRITGRRPRGSRRRRDRNRRGAATRVNQWQADRPAPHPQSHGLLAARADSLGTRGIPNLWPVPVTYWVAVVPAAIGTRQILLKRRPASYLQ